MTGGRPEHEWAGDARIRSVIGALLPDIDFTSDAERLSGGETRRVALASLLAGQHDLLLLDEPTNHLDVEAVAWLAGIMREQGTAMVVVTHDRWFLDAATTATWELADGRLHAYDGGYAAYVLARAERARIADATQRRRRNLLRKELAWLRRGPPARTSKPQFRIDAANALIGRGRAAYQTGIGRQLRLAAHGSEDRDRERRGSMIGARAPGPIALDDDAGQRGPGTGSVPGPNGAGGRLRLWVPLAGIWARGRGREGWGFGW